MGLPVSTVRGQLRGAFAPSAKTTWTVVAESARTDTVRSTRTAAGSCHETQTARFRRRQMSTLAFSPTDRTTRSYRRSLYTRSPRTVINSDNQRVSSRHRLPTCSRHCVDAAGDAAAAAGGGDGRTGCGDQDHRPTWTPRPAC